MTEVVEMTREGKEELEAELGISIFRRTGRDAAPSRCPS